MSKSTQFLVTSGRFRVYIPFLALIIWSLSPSASFATNQEHRSTIELHERRSLFSRCSAFFSSLFGRSSASRFVTTESAVSSDIKLFKELAKDLDDGVYDYALTLLRNEKFPREIPLEAALNRLRAIPTSIPDSNLAIAIQLTLQPARFGDLSSKELQLFSRELSGQTTSKFVADLVPSPNTDPFMGIGELRTLQTILAKTRREQLESLSQWLVSPSHALYLYDRYARTGEIDYGVMNYLMKTHPHYQGTSRTRGRPGSLLGYSYEKETKNPRLVEMFRQANISKEEWDAIPLSARWTKFRDLRDSDPLERTSLAPRSASMPKYEIDGHAEFTHKAYEINRKTLLDDMRRIAKELKENDFHVHISFQVPKNYSDMNSFNHWLKQANDFLYLRGLEERGMHEGKYTKLPDSPRSELRTFDPARSVFQRPPRGEPDPSKRERNWPLGPEDGLSASSANAFKMRGIGLRGGLYGEATSPEHVRIGIELRDPTRDMDVWEKLVADFSKSLENYVWERPAPTLSNTLALTPGTPVELSNADIAPLLTSSTARESFRTMAAVERMMLMPLQPFETSQFRDYRTGGFRQASPEHSERIKKARENYLRSLQNLQKELEDYRMRGESVEDEDLQAAIRMSISEWAKEAQVSQLFGGI